MAHRSAAFAAKRRFYAQVASENQDVLFPSLIEAIPRVKQSLSTSTLYHHTNVLPPLKTPAAETTPTANTLSIPATYTLATPQIDNNLPATDIAPVETPVKTHVKTPIYVVGMDSFDCAEKLTRENYPAVTVLNMASSTTPGGGYLSGAGAQEEALCRRSTLYLSIRRQRHFHPIPAHGGIYSPDVLVLRTSDDAGCTLLPDDKRWWTSVISVAAIRNPKVTESGEYADPEDQESMVERVRTVLRIATDQGRESLVLGSLGCGAFRNPPKAVAGIFKSVFEEEEFIGRFKGIWFAVIERGGSENYRVFKDVLDGMEI
jgi:uncharacterized protein (TIGR02452 family)